MPFLDNVYEYDEFIGEKYPFLMNYFENGIKSTDKNIAHCILFYGNDVEAQYDLAIEIARLLNCKQGRTPDCSCLNCNWIRENKHPAILTISRVDNKPPKDESKTVISIEQARMIKNDLLVTSEYHRVLIFCDRDKDGRITGLNQQNFQADAANALLKTFEEPPSNTTFFFLTNDKTDMISTIISRAQCFFVPSKKEENRDFSLVKKVMDGYLELERNEVLDLYEDLYLLAKENDPEEVLTQMENYIAAILYSELMVGWAKRSVPTYTADDSALKIKLLHDIKAVEKAKKEVQLNMNIQTVLETLCFELIL